MIEKYALGFVAKTSRNKAYIVTELGRDPISSDKLLVLGGKGRITTSFLEAFVRDGGLLNYRRFFKLIALDYPYSRRASLLEAQLQCLDGGEYLEYAREFVSVSTSNKVFILELLAGSGYEVDEEKEYISSINLGKPRSLDELRSYEATIHRVYFDALKKVIPSEYGFKERTRKPPRDPFSAALSYGYMRLYRYCEVAVKAAGLEPRVGFLHKPSRDRPSLALDLAEEFRQPLVDSTLIPLFTGKALKPRYHFRREGEAVYLSRRGGAKVAEALRKRMLMKLSGKTLLEYIYLHAEKLAKSLLGEERYSGFRLHMYLQP